MPVSTDRDVDRCVGEGRVRHHREHLEVRQAGGRPPRRCGGRRARRTGRCRRGCATEALHVPMGSPSRRMRSPHQVAGGSVNRPVRRPNDAVATRPCARSRPSPRCPRMPSPGWRSAGRRAADHAADPARRGLEDALRPAGREVGLDGEVAVEQGVGRVVVERRERGGLVVDGPRRRRPSRARSRGRRRTSSAAGSWGPRPRRRSASSSRGSTRQPYAATSAPAPRRLDPSH